MKLRSLLLTATLVLNGVLALSFFTRSTRTESEQSAGGTTPAVATPTVEKPLTLSAEATRNQATGQALVRLQSRIGRLQPAAPTDPRYWRNPAQLRNPYTAAQRREFAEAQQEFAEAMRELRGENVFADPVVDASRSYLPAEKRDALARIERDYNEQIAAIRREGEIIQLISDRDAIRSLSEAKQKAIAALLTPEEREMLDLRESATAIGLRARFGEGLESEADYRTVFALQKAFDAKYPDTGSPERTTSTLEGSRIRREAEPELGREIREALGEEKFDALARANDQDRRMLTSLSHALDFSPTVVDTLIASRDAYALESQNIGSNAELSAAEKSTRMQELAKRARGEIATSLSGEAASAYLQYASWLRYLDQGWDFTADFKFMRSSGSRSVSPLQFSSVPMSILRPPVGPR